MNTHVKVHNVSFAFPELLAGLLEPTVRTIDIADVPRGQRLGQVAYMPQKDLLLSWRTVMENCIDL